MTWTDLEEHTEIDTTCCGWFFGVMAASVSLPDLIAARDIHTNFLYIFYLI